MSKDKITDIELAYDNKKDELFKNLNDLSKLGRKVGCEELDMAEDVVDMVEEVFGLRYEKEI